MSNPYLRFMNGSLSVRGIKRVQYEIEMPKPIPARVPEVVASVTIPVVPDIVLEQPRPIEVVPEPAPAPEPVPEPAPVEPVPEPVPEPAPVEVVPEPSQVESPLEVADAPAEAGLVPEDPPA